MYLTRLDLSYPWGKITRASESFMLPFELKRESRSMIFTHFFIPNKKIYTILIFKFQRILLWIFKEPLKCFANNQSPSDIL